MLRLAAFVVLASSVSSQCFYKDDFAFGLNPDARSTLHDGQLEFTLNLFTAVNDAVPKANIVFSPFSVYNSLLLAYIASGEQTEVALRKSLKITSDMDKLNLILVYKLNKMLQKMNNNAYEFISANKMFVDNGLQVRECLNYILEEELERLNFRENPEESRDYINSWVSNVTKNNINSLIPQDGVSENTQLVLANAAYFKGAWASKFPVEQTKNKTFFVSEHYHTLTPFMNQKGTFNYMVNDDLGAQILELPYEGNLASMFILLPNSIKEGVSNIIAKLTPEHLSAVVEETYIGQELIVEIPKFTIEKSLPLREILVNVGAGNLFDETADFSTLTDQEGVLFEDAVHKAKIQIDEEGTVAAAATALFSSRSARLSEPNRFVANSPFVYFVYERRTNSVLFMGVYRHTWM